MKINSLYIHAFGGLKNLTLDFSDNFNVIYGDNEMGKTTVMTFIKMMFYGSGRASSQLSKNTRLKYTPWDGSQMAGSIDFEHNGKRYRLEKEFRSSNSTDKATLCDIDMGTRQAVSSDIGASFFRISLSAFERSVFIGQLGFPEKDSAAEGELNSKLSNMALTGEESISFEAVNSRLQKAKLSLMSKSGKAGIYDKNLKLMGEIKDRIEKNEATARAITEKKNKIASLESEMEYFGKKALALKEKISTEQDVRNAEKLSQLLELKKQLDSLNETLKLNDSSLIDEMYLRKLQFCISKVQAAEDKINAKQKEIELLHKSIEAGLNPPKDASPETAERLKEEIKGFESKKEQNLSLKNKLNSKIQECEILGRQKKPFLGFIALIAGILFLAAAVMLNIISFTVPFIICAVIGAIFTLACPIYLISLKSAKAKISAATAKLKEQLGLVEAEDSRISKEMFDIKIKLEAITAALNSSAAVIEKQQQLLTESETELASFTQEKSSEEKALFEQFSKYRPADTLQEVLTALEEIGQKAAKQKELKQQLNFILNDLNGISYAEAEKKLATVRESELSLSEDFGQLKAEYEQLISHITDRKSEIAALTAELRSALSGAEDTEQLKKQLNALMEKTTSQKEFCLCLDVATAVLAESFAEVRRSYGSVLEKKAGHFFEGLTDNKYSSMSISKELDINVERKDVFGSREIDYLSSGTADQAYLSMRLALAELMQDGNEELPIFLDDALTQYDDGRMKTAVSFLKEYSEKTQVIMFTCHNSIYEISKEAGADCKKIG